MLTSTAERNGNRHLNTIHSKTRMRSLRCQHNARPSPRSYMGDAHCWKILCTFSLLEKSVTHIVLSINTLNGWRADNVWFPKGVDRTLRNTDRVCTFWISPQPFDLWKPTIFIYLRVHYKMLSLFVSTSKGTDLKKSLFHALSQTLCWCSFTSEFPASSRIKRIACQGSIE